MDGHPIWLVFLITGQTVTLPAESFKVPRWGRWVTFFDEGRTVGKFRKSAVLFIAEIEQGDDDDDDFPYDPDDPDDLLGAAIDAALIHIVGHAGETNEVEYQDQPDPVGV